jgi:hypothetical protein
VRAHIYVPFKYDLGGRIADIPLFLERMAESLAPLERDPAAARSFNLSYLASHPSVLRADLDGTQIQLGSQQYSVARRLRIYPWLGVVSLDHLFEPADGDELSQDDLLRFYDRLVQLKNEDYLTYLDESGAMTEGLRERTGYAGPLASKRLELAHYVQMVRDAAASSELSHRDGRRPGIYAFHDFRLVFALEDQSDLSPTLIHALTNLAPSPDDLVSGSPPPELAWGRGFEVHSSGWVTVVFSNPVADPGCDVKLETVLSLFSLCHAQWFLCQAWLYIYEGTGATAAVRRQRLGEPSNDQLLLTQDLTEIGNLDVMLKDPELIRLAQFFVGALGIERHREAARQRLEVLTSFYQKMVDYRTGRDAQRLQLLFSFSAAAAVAALVPPLASLQEPYAVFTVVVAIGLWAAFTINFVVVIARLRRRREPFRE